MLRKEDVCVLIDTPEKAMEVLEILENANESMSPHCYATLKSITYLDITKYLRYSIILERFVLCNFKYNENLMSLDDLRKILLPNEGQEERFVL